MYVCWLTWHFPSPDILLPIVLMAALKPSSGTRNSCHSNWSDTETCTEAFKELACYNKLPMTNITWLMMCKKKKNFAKSQSYKDLHWNHIVRIISKERYFCLPSLRPWPLTNSPLPCKRHIVDIWKTQSDFSIHCRQSKPLTRLKNTTAGECEKYHALWLPHLSKLLKLFV